MLIETYRVNEFPHFLLRFISPLREACDQIIPFRQGYCSRKSSIYKVLPVYAMFGSHLISHLSLNREGRWGTSDDFAATSFLHFPCSPLPSGTWRTPGLSIPSCCLPTTSFVRLVFFPLSLCLARWFWPDLMNGKRDHTTAVCVSLRSSGDLRLVPLPAGAWHRLPHW